MTYLGMQILIEGLALAAFQRIRDFAKNRLAASVNAYVMQDEARHVAFGAARAARLSTPQLSDGERAEREEFVVEACYHMRDRFNQKELWENLGLPVKEAIEVAMASENMRLFRKRLFSPIVPTVKDIGLWARACRRRSPTWAPSSSPTSTATRCSIRTTAWRKNSTPRLRAQEPGVAGTTRVVPARVSSGSRSAPPSNR